MAKTHQRSLSVLRGLQGLSHFFNFILLIVGGGAAAVGFWIFYTFRMGGERAGVVDIVGFIYLFANLCTISEGIILVVISLLGIIAICTRHRCTLIWYFSLLVVACVTSLLFTIMTFWIFFQLESTVNAELSNSLENDYGLFGNKEITELWDNIQRSFQCCGSKSYRDWQSSEWYHVQRLGYFDQSEAPLRPDTCCVLSSEGHPSNLTTCVHSNADSLNMFIYTAPCSEKLYEWMHWPTLYLAFAGVAVFFSAVFEIGTISVLLRTLGPMERRSKPTEKQLLTTSVHSESENSWSSSKERTKKSNPQIEPQEPNVDEITNDETLSIEGYENNAFKNDSDEETTPL